MRRTRDRREASAAVAVLHAVHKKPGAERSTLASELGLTSGFMSETLGRLTTLDLVLERPAPPRGTRGRPTTTLHPHPQGPLVVAVAIAHETWRLAVVELGGTQVAQVQRAHQRDPDDVLAALQGELRAVRRRYGRRLSALAVAVPGTASGNRLVHAANLGWHDLDFDRLRPRNQGDLPFLLGNDATYAAIAETQRGSASSGQTALHLFMDAGIGGAVIERGRLLTGAHGLAGEFGHMPFGDGGRSCRCGARGCWNTSIDGAAIATLLGHSPPVDEVTYTRQVLTAAQASAGAGEAIARPELAAIEEVARAIGRGAAGLVNAFDPDIVTLGGLGRELLAIADVQLQPAYLLGLMQRRTSAPPPLVPSFFGDDAPLVGAAEQAMAAVLDEAGVRRWEARRPA